MHERGNSSVTVTRHSCGESRDGVGGMVVVGGDVVMDTSDAERRMRIV